jgi:predicted alpha/beta superfamily hydrolase
LIAGWSNRKLINRQARPSNELARLALYSIFGEASRFSMPKHTLTGNIKRHRAFPSKILGNRRDVLVYLPRGYRRFSRRRYPVLYLQDGQNVFDAATSFSGVEWGVDEAAERLIKENLIEPLIVVAVANTGEQRIDEYAPTRGVIDAKAKRKKRSKGLARKYGHFLMDELKPYIDRKYRTNPGAEFTGLGGSSLGGLVTFAIGILYPQVFGRLMVMSPSIWWDNFAIYRLVDSIEQKPPLKIWLDTGTAEPGWEQARELLNRLVEKGLKLQKDLQYMEAQGAGHSEAAWAARVEPALRFLFPPGR